MFVTEKRGLYAKKRMRSVFLFTNCVVVTKPRLRKDAGGRSYDELRYKGSIQVAEWFVLCPMDFCHSLAMSPSWSWIGLVLLFCAGYVLQRL